MATVQPLDGEGVAAPSAGIIELTELLQRSLKSPAPAAKGGRARPAAANDEAASVKRAAAGKAVATSRAAPPVALAAAGGGGAAICSNMGRHSWRR